MRTSFSALETFRTCPLKFKYQEIDRIRTPKSKEAMLGTAIHSALRYYHGSGPLFPTLEDVLRYYQEHWKGETVEWKSKEEERAFYEDGKAMLEKYCASHDPREAKILDLEVKFEAPIEDPKTKEMHILSGKIDRIDKDDEGAVEIIDYKTAKRMPSQARANESLQLAIYHLGLKHHWPELRPKKVKLSLYFLRHNEKLSTRGMEEKIEETRQHVLHLIDEIKKSDFQPTPGPLCDWCGYRPICPMWSHEYKREDRTLKQKEVRTVVREYFSLKGQEQQIAKRLKELRKLIEAYYDEAGLERVFGEEGHITRTPKKRFRYDMQKVKDVLEPLGFWEEVLSLDMQKLKKILSSLPSSEREKIEEARIFEREYKIITVTKKTKGFQEASPKST